MDLFTCLTTIISLLLSIISIALTIYITYITSDIQRRDNYLSNVERMCTKCLITILDELAKLENKLPLLDDAQLAEKIITNYNKLYFYVKDNADKKNKRIKNYIYDNFQKEIIKFYNNYNENILIYKNNDASRSIFYQKIMNSLLGVKKNLGELYGK